MTIHSTLLALTIIASTACIVAPSTTNGQSASSPTTESKPAPAHGCVPRPDEQRQSHQELSGLRVQDFRVIEPLVAGGTGRVSVVLAETSGIPHGAYPGIRTFSDSATIESNAQLYGIGGCDENPFTLIVTPNPDVRAGETIELNFQAGNLACKRGDYPCDGEILTVSVQVVEHR